MRYERLLTDKSTASSPYARLAEFGRIWQLVVLLYAFLATLALWTLAQAPPGAKLTGQTCGSGRSVGPASPWRLPHVLAAIHRHGWLRAALFLLPSFGPMQRLQRPPDCMVCCQAEKLAPPAVCPLRHGLPHTLTVQSNPSRRHPAPAPPLPVAHRRPPLRWSCHLPGPPPPACRRHPAAACSRRAAAARWQQPRLAARLARPGSPLPPARLAGL